MFCEKSMGKICRIHPHVHRQLYAICPRDTDKIHVRLVDDIPPMPEKGFSIFIHAEKIKWRLTSLPFQVAASKDKITKDSGLSVALNSVNASATPHPTQSGIVHS